MSVGRSKACYGWIIWAMAVVFTVLEEWKHCDGCWEQERISLLHLNMSSWSGTNSSDDDNCCLWDGVRCDPATGKVRELDLSYPYVSDFNSPAKPDINSSLFLPFQELRRLSLHSVHISGCIQNQGWPNLESLAIDESSISCNNFFETVATVMTNLTRLAIVNSDLSSTIPQALCTLKRLWMLDLSANYLRGELPQCLSNLTSLQSLSASGNRFSGDISLSPLPALLSLKVIDISDNQFRIPISLFPFFNHSRLQYFYGGYNQEIYGDDHLDMVLQQGAPLFQLRDLELYQQPGYGGGYVGSFPKFLYHQTKLESVCITNVNITGVAAGFPWWLLTNNTHLEFLYLSNCSLSGHFQIPIHQQQQYPPHENLRELYISTNEFFPGPIPPDICAFFPNLDRLSLSDNKFYGEIPSHLSNCSSFRLLDASNNQLSGEISRWIWNMSVDSIIDLSKNKFSGHLPPGFISPLIKEVYLSRNQLEGTLPATLSDIQDGMSGADNYTNYLIGVLDLSHNHLMGTIPKWIGGLRQLSYIFLNDNQFHGELPGTFCLETSKLIDVSHNYLSGHIDYDIFTSNGINCNARNAYDDPQRDLEFVTKTRLYTYQGMPLYLINGLDFSSNNFTGEIPPQIGHLGDTNTLNFSYNLFTGHIPTTIANLSQIESLDLSHNDLSGVIPTQLTELNSLSSFNVAYNNLSGRCPKRIGQFATFNEDIYWGNPLLVNCTSSQSTRKPPVKQTPTDDDDDEDGCYIDMGSFYASSGVSFVMVLLTIASVLYINPYWRQVWFYYVGVTITTCYYFVVDHLPVPTRYKVWELRV